MKPTQRILIIRAGQLGDTVFATSIIEPLHAQFGEHIQIDWLLKQGMGALFKEDKRIERIFSIKHRKLPVWLSAEKRAVIKHAKQHPYDLIINLEYGSLFDDMIKKIPCPMVIGSPNPIPHSNNDNLHAVYDLHNLYKQIIHQEYLPLAIPSVQASDSSTICNKLKIKKPYITLATTNSTQAKPGRPNLRAWPTSHWQTLIQSLSTFTQFDILLIGTPSDKAYIDSLLPESPTPHIRNIAGDTSIPELISLLSATQLLVTTDTGPMHLAAAQDSPILLLTGSANMHRTGPLNATPENVDIINLELECSPCYGTAQKDLCTDNRCMKGISPEQVLKQIQRRLEN